MCPQLICIIGFGRLKARHVILATTAWSEVLEGFLFCYMYFLLLRHEQKNVKNSGALEPNGSQVNSSL